MLVQHLLLHVSYVLAGTVPNPAPASPVSAGDVNLLLGYAKFGAFIACGASALVSGGAMAVGHLSSRPDVADRGKRGLLWSLGGGAVTALAIPVLNTIIGSVH
jgi:hypothetical protein